MHTSASAQPGINQLPAAIAGFTQLMADLRTLLSQQTEEVAAVATSFDFSTFAPGVRLLAGCGPYDPQE
jgi:hypothetical protein